MRGILAIFVGAMVVAPAMAGKFRGLKFTTMTPTNVRPFMQVERPLIALESDIGACGGSASFLVNVDLYISPDGAVTRTEIAWADPKRAPDSALFECIDGVSKKPRFKPAKREMSVRFSAVYDR